MFSSSVNVGDEIELAISGTGKKGDFFGRYRGLVIFVRELKKVSMGEKIRVEITEIKDRCAFARKI